MSETSFHGSASVLGRLEALVIGASAGGVDALVKLVPAFPAQTKVSIAIVLHLSRQYPSSLAEIFGPKCALPVREAEDKIPFESGAVYFGPPDYHLLVDTGPCLALSADEPINFSRPSIDVLFESAADQFGDRLGGVILTGSNTDGAAGLDAVRRAGGVTIVQEPATAFASNMPSAALGRGKADFVLSLDGIARLFASLPIRSDQVNRP